MRIIIETEDKDLPSSTSEQTRKSETSTEAINAGQPAESLVQAVTEAITAAVPHGALYRDGADAGAAPAELVEILSSVASQAGGKQH